MGNSNTDPPPPQEWPPRRNSNDTYSDPNRSPHHILPPTPDATREADRNRRELERTHGIPQKKGR